MSVTEVSQRAGTSESTVIRCCQQLGFSGFQDLKLRLARESYPGVRLVHQDITDDDPPLEVLTKIVAANVKVVQDCLSTIDGAAFDAVVARIAEGGRLLVLGSGQSSAPALDAAYRFRMIGLQSDAPTDYFTRHLAARLLTQADTCIAISHTGATRETLAVMETARASGAVTVAVTSFARSPLAAIVDHALVAGGRSPVAGETGDAVVSRLAHLTVLDAIFVSVVLRRMGPSLEALDRLNEVTAEHQL
jgi:DNA-binding MurR/RpiR family transcriptional regulator